LLKLNDDDDDDDEIPPKTDKMRELFTVNIQSL